ncbi:MAG: HTH domain-containing protein [Myxococcota bacterium]|jgi:HJR/Mrr/RecB family endonuclease|nr:HTH domain-containing protein [Myxococcota bacterium]
MTFIEAALAVLEREGRAMHAREIAEKAVELGILSHVGKTPVQTMSGRLSAALQRAEDSSPFVRTKPGVFALAAWGNKAPGPKPKSAPLPASRSTPPPPPPLAMGAQAALAPFTVDLDDDEADAEEIPISTATDPSHENDANRSKRKRRRKRKQRTDEPVPGLSAAPVEDKPESPEVSAKRAEPPRPAPKPLVPASEPVAAESSCALLSSEDILEKVESVLRKATRPLPASQVAEQVGKASAKGTWLVEALLEGDNLSREQQGHRPRFVERRAGWTLVEKEVPSEILATERTIAEARDRLTRLGERQVLRKLRSLSPMAFGKSMIIYLHASGFEGFRPVERGGKDELHLTVSDRRAGRRFRTAVVLRRSGAEDVLSDRVVVELRGSLHHYDAASILVITTGTVSEAARKEAAVPHLPPVSLVDAESLARDMVRLGLGVEQRRIVLPAFDEGFFGALSE